MKDNACKVLMRSETGDEIVVTVTTGHKLPLDEKAFKKLKLGVSNKIVPNLDSCIYFTVRITIDGVKNNWKCKTIDELNSVLKGVFKVEESIID